MKVKELPSEKVTYIREGATARAVRLLSHIGRTPREAVVAELRKLRRQGIVSCVAKGSTHRRKVSVFRAGR